MIKVTVWNECRHEKEDADVQEVYPETIGGCIVNQLQPFGFDLTLATLDDPEQGWPADRIAETEVAIWWGHRYHDELDDALIDKLQARVLAGMGLIVLHSGHHAKLFKRLMGTSCNLSWREAEGGERERVWCLKPAHPIAYNIPPQIELPQSEMYGEPFDIPEPDELIFNSWYQGGEVLRSGCTFSRGRGRIFFFAPGHETFPIYRNEHITQILANAIQWAHQPHTSGWMMGNWGRPVPLEEGAPKQTYFKKPRKLMLAEKAAKKDKEEG